MTVLFLDWFSKVSSGTVSFLSAVDSHLLEAIIAYVSGTPELKVSFD